MKDCMSTEYVTKIMCDDKMNDYQECKTGQRIKEYRSWYNLEFKKIKILSLPQYDDVTDSFIDPTHPASADSFFTNDDKLKDFFSPKIEEKKNKHGNKHH
eukprot:CAMPEP_0170514456 /NCGR_PEP_ID=MMETSP0209-20121228/1030_1 /TAXON_ID=665100 ORGANISM="Litonotus pictus, Strain P1" /NCGR_SAMPLE_ID=MMETSP0209 /ASSEMBLY_ACC=CAM_ASM_000301 /LENGTH=99 /DNA_ID=CAMNT_0010798551 /DNA_START=63 /DNA_END=362 /DNA_ORIENTATION=+